MQIHFAEYQSKLTIVQKFINHFVEMLMVAIPPVSVMAPRDLPGVMAVLCALYTVKPAAPSELTPQSWTGYDG